MSADRHAAPAPDPRTTCVPRRVATATRSRPNRPHRRNGRPSVVGDAATPAATLGVRAAAPARRHLVCERDTTGRRRPATRGGRRRTGPALVAAGRLPGCRPHPGRGDTRRGPRPATGVRRHIDRCLEQCRRRYRRVSHANVYKQISKSRRTGTCCAGLPENGVATVPWPTTRTQPVVAARIGRRRAVRALRVCCRRPHAGQRREPPDRAAVLPNGGRVHETECPARVARGLVRKLPRSEHTRKQILLRRYTEINTSASPRRSTGLPQSLAPHGTWFDS